MMNKLIQGKLQPGAEVGGSNPDCKVLFCGHDTNLSLPENDGSLLQILREGVGSCYYVAHLVLHDKIVLLSPSLKTNGYLYVMLCIDDVSRET